MRRGFVQCACVWFSIPLFAIVMSAIVAVAAEPEQAATAPVAIPDTPAGRRLAWMIEALNGERIPQPDEVRGQFSQKFNELITVRIIRLAREAIAPVSLVGFRDAIRERAVVALLRDRSGGEHRLELGTDEDSGDRIADWWFGAGAAITPDQIGVTAWDMAHYSPLPGAPIELVDGVTGESLDPPQRCVGNFLGYCRFTPPRDLETVAIKLNSRLLFSELETIHYYPAELLRGGEYWVLAAESRARIDESRKLSSYPVGSREASLAGIVAYYGASDREYVGRAGCAKIELSPSQTKILYANPQTVLPDPTRSLTESREARWFVPEIESGSYLATARVGNRVGSMRLPRVEPGAHHVLWIPIYLSDEERKSGPPRCD